MEKKKYKSIPRSKMERIGIPTGLLDCNGSEIISGDYISLRNTNYSGRILYNKYEKSFGLYMGLWYGQKDEYDPECYGKFIKIPKDNGMRMEIIKEDE